MKKKNFTAIILARGGSKAIKLKNLVKVNGKPLLYWTIKSCLKSKNIQSIWVSTDNKLIADYAKKLGVSTIFRPNKYAKDNLNNSFLFFSALKSEGLIDKAAALSPVFLKNFRRLIKLIISPWNL